MKRNIFNAIQVYLYSTLHNRCCSTDNDQMTNSNDQDTNTFNFKKLSQIYLFIVCQKTLLFFSYLLLM